MLEKFATLTFCDDFPAPSKLRNVKRRVLDVQLWHAKVSPTKFVIPQDSPWRRVGYLSMHLVPVYLHRCSPFQVFSELDATVQYFKEHVAGTPPPYGLLFANPNCDQYLLFHAALRPGSDGILASCLDFSTISNAMALFDRCGGRENVTNEKSVLVADDDTSPPIENTAVFDRVLKIKKRTLLRNFPPAGPPACPKLPEKPSLSKSLSVNSGRCNPLSVNTGLCKSASVNSGWSVNSGLCNSTSVNSGLSVNSAFSVTSDQSAISSQSANSDQSSTAKPLTSQHISPDQISYTLGRLVLAGLRVRGISTNISHLLNEQLSIKELYQMTLRAATFALRKYANSLVALLPTNTNPGIRRRPRDPIPLSVLQDIVERLLQVFVDLDDRSNFK